MEICCETPVVDKESGTTNNLNNSMEDTATIRIGNENFTYPLIVGSEGEVGIDTRRLRADSGCITFDEGYGNTGSCISKITFINGEKGILRYRGYPIEQLADESTFIEAAYLIMYGELPKANHLQDFRNRVLKSTRIHRGMQSMVDSFPHDVHPMAMLSAMLNALGGYFPELATNNREQDLANFDEAAAKLISKVRTLAAMSYRMKHGLPFIYPKPDSGYTDNFLHMMFSEPYAEYELHQDVSKALDLIFLLHADHEQNCSTSTVRMVASGGANLFASVAAGVCALWGPLHGGANMAVLKQLQAIYDDGDDGSRYVEAAKRGEARLMGFGHRVYKNYDPRAKILGQNCSKVLKAIGVKDPLLDIARLLEEKALSDEYFIQRSLYPNVDFYSGIILRAIGIPLDMFTVIFAIGRMPGWIANWKEIADEKSRIHRPRQIYNGSTERKYVPLKKR